MRTRYPSLIVAIVVATMLTAMSAGASGSKPADGKYKGETGPGYPMHFDVVDNGARITKLDVAFEATCDPGAGSVAPVFDFGTVTIHDGTFSGETTRSFGPTVSDFVRIEGKFKDDQFTGKVTDTQRITSLPTCTQSEPFSAKPVS